VILDEPYDICSVERKHEEGLDFIPSSIDLAAVEVMLVSVMSRERMLRIILLDLRSLCEYIIIDCIPSLGILTINALTCADSVIIPVQVGFLPIKSLQQLFSTIGKVRRQIPPGLGIGGVLFTMADGRTNNSKMIMDNIRSTYGETI